MYIYIYIYIYIHTTLNGFQAFKYTYIYIYFCGRRLSFIKKKAIVKRLCGALPSHHFFPSP